ncbi:hypothetical protein FP435_04785 [Lactobacillus sp. PV037]|uniref:hypothetical protein n=1 Tax=Lactobacillus sp. PV037 TaxID=2594496 RepID=UPI00223EF9D1|nr:hypothetical protein [Lactobacillus sp. PV037]QNQ83807.1 hypothetical protein FP435_04785 [Lactobacillus sp. PV037]
MNGIDTAAEMVKALTKPQRDLQSVVEKLSKPIIKFEGVDAMKKQATVVSEISNSASIEKFAATQVPDGNPITLSHSNEWLFIYSISSRSSNGKISIFSFKIR